MRSVSNNRGLALRVVRGLARNALHDQHTLRAVFVRDVWAVTKRFAATGIQDVYPHMIAGLADEVVASPLDETNRAMLAGLCRTVNAKSFFEFGTHRGLTAWTVARNNPDLTVYTLDLPPGETLDAVSLDSDVTEVAFSGDGSERGEAFRGTPEAERITVLEGDSASFDYSPYEGSMDVVYVDGGHSYEHVRNDTQAARRMLRQGGLIVWDDYPWWPGVYQALTELPSVLPGEMLHILTTRLVVYSERNLLL